MHIKRIFLDDDTPVTASKELSKNDYQNHECLDTDSPAMDDEALQNVMENILENVSEEPTGEDNVSADRETSLILEYSILSS